MRIVVTGATGFLGRPLCAELAAKGHAITALSRDARRASSVLGPSIACLSWNGSSGSGEPWKRAVADADTIIHLAGAPVAAKAWTEEIKVELRRSRIETTRALVDVMRTARKPPAAFVCASGINYYGDGGEQTLTEESPPGRTFLAELSVAWEIEARKAEEFGVRVVRHRAGVVLEHGGPLDKILFPLPFRVSPWRLGLGGPIGNGRQWFPWIHLQDVISMFAWSATDSRVAGAVNTVAPQLIRNLEFSRALGRVMHRPAVLPIPGFILKFMVGGFTDELMTSQRAVPLVAQNLGYVFKHPQIDEALRSILLKDKK